MAQAHERDHSTPTLPGERPEKPASGAYYRVKVRGMKEDYTSTNWHDAEWYAVLMLEENYEVTVTKEWV